jgi:hypothetical protein
MIYNIESTYTILYMSISSYTYISSAIRAGGGFYTEQYFGEIPFIGSIGTDLIQLYDLTNTLQIDYDVRIFNEKLGIYKDSLNENVIDSTNSLIYDTSTGYVNNDDNITLSVDDFLDHISDSQVTGLGKYSTLHSEFIRKTNTYFGYADGFERIFDASGTTDVIDNPFTAENLLQILQQRVTDDSGNERYKLSGSVNLYQLTNLLSFMSLNNHFSNRLGKTQFDGFFAGDRILIESGITISLAVTTYNATYINEAVSNANTILQYTVNAPLLLTLQNLS